MDIRQKTIIKNYIKKLLKEASSSETLGTQTAQKTTIMSLLAKKENKPQNIGPQEIESIKSAIKVKYPNKSSLDVENNTISFSIPHSPNNLNFTLRKIINPGTEKNQDIQYKYLLIITPFKAIEDLGKEQIQNLDYSDPFDNKINSTQLLGIISKFIGKALLPNKT
jgi:hypothetical protein